MIDVEKELNEENIQKNFNELVAGLNEAQRATFEKIPPGRYLLGENPCVLLQYSKDGLLRVGVMSAYGKPEIIEGVSAQELNPATTDEEKLLATELGIMFTALAMIKGKGSPHA